MSAYTKAARFTSSKKDCVCAETGRPIRKGDTVYVEPATGSVYATHSSKAKNQVDAARVGAKLGQRLTGRL